MLGIRSGGTGRTVPLPAAMLACLNQLTAFDPIWLAQTLDLLTQLSAMPGPSLTILSRAADNTETRTDLPLAAGNYQLSVDSNLAVSLTPTAMVNPTRAGAVVLALTDATKDVVFATPMPDANYQVGLLLNGLSGACKVLSQTATGFKLSITSPIGGTIGYTATHNA